MALTLDAEPGSISDLHWAESGGALKTEPTEMSKTTGFVPTEAPSLHAWNWFFNLVAAFGTWARNSITTLNTGKFDANINMIPTTDLAVKIGDSTHRYTEAHAAVIKANTLTVSSASRLSVSAILAPDNTDVRDLGAASFKWATIWGLLVKATEMLPIVSGDNLGSSSLRWDAFLRTTSVSQSLTVGTTLAVVGDGSVGGDFSLDGHILFGGGANPVAKASRHNAVLACAKISAGGVAQPGFHNIASVNHTGTGVYVINFIDPITDGTLEPSLQVTSTVSGFASVVRTGNAQIQVDLKTNAFVADDQQFFLTVVGSADF